MGRVNQCLKMDDIMRTGWTVVERYTSKLFIKGTVSVISSNHICAKMSMPDSQKIRLAHFYCKKSEIIKNTFKPGKTTIPSTCLIRERFKR